MADLRNHKHGQNESQRYRGSGRPSMVTTDDDSSYVKKRKKKKNAPVSSLKPTFFWNELLLNTVFE